MAGRYLWILNILLLTCFLSHVQCDLNCNRPAIMVESHSDELVQSKGLFANKYASLLERMEQMRTMCADAYGIDYIPELSDPQYDRLGDAIPFTDYLIQKYYGCRKIVNSRSTRDVVNHEELNTIDLWDLPIKYTFNRGQSESAIDNIMAAMDAWSSRTCITFEQVAETDDPHVLFTAEETTGCWSFYGKIVTAKAQVVNLQNGVCTNKIGTIIHELGHLLGFLHTQGRSDRDDSVVVHHTNATSYHRMNFLKESERSAKTYDLPYDYNSIMHYRKNFFAQNADLVTVETLDPKYMSSIGQRSRLSFYDVKLANLVYCADSCANSDTTCYHGGYPDPRDCSSCLCNDGLGGEGCQGVDETSSPGCSPLSSHIQATEEEQCIASPGYGEGGYQDGDQCNWRITASEGSQISYRFDGDFGLICSSTATCEQWLEINDHPDLDKPGYRYCCSRPQGVMTSQSNEMVASFRSDASGSSEERTGFRMCFWID